MKVVEFKKKQKYLQYEYVAMRAITQDDFQKAEYMAGLQSPEKFMTALISEVCTFDGKKYTMEELFSLKPKNLAELCGIIGIKLKWQDYNK